MKRELLSLQFLDTIEPSPRQRGYTIGITIKMQQRVRIRLRTVRYVVGDKMFEIPDSLNKRGTTNKRHSFGPGFAPERRTFVETGSRIVWRSQIPC